MNNKVIQYDNDIINQVLINENELPSIYKTKYDDAFEIIKKSDNYHHINTLLKSMIKITKQQNYSETDTNKMFLISLLNKLTNKNYKSIKNKLINNIKYSNEMLKYLCDNLFLKILNDTKYNNLYVNLVIEISKENNFYIDETNNFITNMICKCSSLYNLKISKNNNYINDIKKEENTNITNYFKTKLILKNLLLFISKLIYNELLSKNLIDYILDDLLVECTFRIELLCCFININNIFSQKQHTQINNYLNSIKNNYDSRIKYLIDEIKIEKEIVDEINVPDKEINIIIDNNMKLNNLLNEYLIHNNEKESIKYLNEFIKGYNDIIKDLLYIIFDYEQNKFNKILVLFKKFLDLKIPFQINILDDINEEFNELILDFPLSKIFYNTILKELVKYKYLEKQDYNLIYTQYIDV